MDDTETGNSPAQRVVTFPGYCLPSCRSSPSVRLLPEPDRDEKFYTVRYLWFTDGRLANVHRLSLGCTFLVSAFGILACAN